MAEGEGTRPEAPHLGGGPALSKAGAGGRAGGSLQIWAWDGGYTFQTLPSPLFFFNPAWLRNVTGKEKKKKAVEGSRKKKKAGGFGSKGPFRSLYLCKGNHLHVCGDGRARLQSGRRGRAREECGESGRAAGGRAPAEPPSCCCINLLKEPLLCGGSARGSGAAGRPDPRPGRAANWSGK